MSEEKQKKKCVEFYEVARWPEFIALAKRMGINMELPLTRLSIHLQVDEPTRIDCEYFSQEHKEEE